MFSPVPIVQWSGRGPFKAETRVRLPLGTPCLRSLPTAFLLGELRLASQLTREAGWILFAIDSKPLKRQASGVLGSQARALPFPVSGRFTPKR